MIAEFEKSLAPLEDPRVGGVGGRDFLNRSFKRVRLTKKTPGHLVSKVSAQPIPDARLQVSRMHGDSSPGSGLDREGTG